MSQHKPEWVSGSNGRQPNTCMCCDVHRWFEYHPNSYTVEISDSSWRSVWNNLSEQLSTLNNEIAALAVNITKKEQQSPTCTTSQCTTAFRDVDSAEFDEAMKNGTTKMACGRVVMLGDAQVGNRLLVEVLSITINDELSQTSASTTAENQSQCLRRVLQNGTFCTIAEEEENKELALAGYKFMKDNPGSILNTITSSKLKMIKAFYDPSTPSYTEESADDAISDSVKKHVTQIKKVMTGFVQQGEPRTSCSTTSCIELFLK